MRTKGHTFLLAVMAIAFVNSAIAQLHFPSNIIVIKDARTKLIQSGSIEQLLKSKAIDLKVYDLDAVDQFESDISKILPGDESRAKLAFEEYLNRIGREAFEKDSVQAYQGIMAVIRYELKKYPAIIFDGESVIYGVTDLDDALNRYSAWKARQAEIQ